MTTAWVVTSGERVELTAQRTADVLFTVTNNGPVQDRAVFAAVPGDGADGGWFGVEERQRVVDPKASTSYLVQVTVPPGAPAGSYWLQGRVYSADAAPEESSAVSGRVTFDVLPAPEPKKTPIWWWLVPVIALVLVVAGVVIWLLRPTEPEKVAVPALSGRPIGQAEQTAKTAGLRLRSSAAPSNTVEKGRVISQSPAPRTQVLPDSLVVVTVSSGKRAPVVLIDLFPRATLLRSGAGPLLVDQDGGERGFAIKWPETKYLEDGRNGRTFLEMHPEWKADGWIEADFELPAPIIPGDRFRAQIGFMLGARAGAANFVVQAVRDGKVIEVGRQVDFGADGRLPELDVDLTPAVGADTIRLRIEAGQSSGQDWAVWLHPRVEG